MKRALAVLWLAAASVPAQDTVTFPALAERVTVDVVVTDREGRPIAGLTREDFILEDEGAAQQILEFEAIDVSTPGQADAAATPRDRRVATNTQVTAPSRHFLVVFDDLNIAFYNTDRVRDALRSFLEVQLREGDRVTIAPSGGGAFWTGRIGEDRDDLLVFLATLRGRRIPDTSPRRITDVEALRIHVQRDEEAITHVVLRFAAYGLLGVGIGADPDNGQQALQAGRDATRGHVEALASDVYWQGRERSRRTLTNLETAMSSLVGRRGRRSVILASDGFVQDFTLDELQRVREAARRANVAIYFLDARGTRAPDVAPPDMPTHPDPSNEFRYTGLEMELLAEESAGAEALAADTGGLTIRGNDLASGLGRVSLESRTFYLLGYEPTNLRRDGRFRKIKVRVRRPGVVIRARKGYHAGSSRPEKSAADAAAGELGVLDGLLERPDVPLRMAAYVLGDTAGGRATVLLSAEADPAALSLEEEQGKLVGAVESFASVTSRDTREVGSGQRLHELALRPEVRRRMATAWVPITHAFELPPGRYQATLVVRDRASDRVGTVRHEFDVPALRALRLTTPVLSDTLLPGRDPDAPASPAPLARHAFVTGTRLFCRFEVAGTKRETEASAPRVLVSYEIHRRGGAVVTRTDWMPVQPSDGGALVNTFSLTLNRGGAYELRLRARDERTGEEASAVESFDVEGPQG